MPRRRGPSWQAGIAAAVVALLAGSVLGLLLLNRGGAPPSGGPASHDPTPAAAASPTSPTPSASAASPPVSTASPSASPDGATGRTWQETGSFGGGAGPALVHDVATGGQGLVAVGVQYLQPLPNVGPTPPHQGQVWVSADGRSWEDVTPSDVFTNVLIDSVIVRPDGMFVAVGTIHEGRQAGEVEQIDPIGIGAWQSADGRIWTEADLGLPEGTHGARIDEGERGYLAEARQSGVFGLWFSEDAQAWQQVSTTMTELLGIGAGSEGFVALGGAGAPGALEPRGIASADGREWLDASNPPADVASLAPLGPDWIATSWTVTGSLPDHAVTWFSADGIDWTEHAEVGLRSVEAQGAECREHPSGLTSAGEWLVLATTLSFPCSEGGFAVFGTQRISSDGAVWEDLPFTPGTPGTARSGSHVMSSVALDGALVLAGESNGRAGFWIGEAP